MHSLCAAIDPDEVSFDHNFTRLERLLRMPEDTDEIPKVGTDVSIPKIRQ